MVLQSIFRSLEYNYLFIIYLFIKSDWLEIQSWSLFGNYKSLEI